MTDRVTVGNLRVARVLHDFITNEALPGTGVDPDSFWAGVDKVVTDLTPKNQELLARRAFGAQIAVARDTFDMTLIDTPATEVGADAQLVAATCGSAIVVARRHASEHRRVAALSASLRDAGVTVIGGVLLDF